MTVDIKRLIQFSIVLSLVRPIVFSKTVTDLGTIGTVHKIVEKDMLEEINRKLKKMKKNGEISKFNSEMKEKIMYAVKNIRGSDIPRATQYRATEIVPTYKVKKDILDEKGKVLFKKGTTVNSLELRSLSKMICFFDGTDKDQVSWVLKYCASNPINKLVMVKGKYIKLMKKIKRRVYFDQKSYLVKRLKIEALPATLRQHGTKLYVEEHFIN